MPNWIKGTLKLRGKTDDIKRFFIEGLEDNEYKIEYEDDDEMCMAIRNEPYVKGTSRAFIESCYVTVCGDRAVACVPVHQAWDFRADEWEKVSSDYDLDVKLYGIERGMQFVQEITVIRGRNPIINTTRYEDWEWECPFPYMVG
jgi:hypothetical protein